MLLGKLQSCLAKPASLGRVLHEVQDRVGQRGHVFFRNEPAGLPVANRVRDPAHRGCHDRLAMQVGFDGPDAKPLGIATIVNDGRIHPDIATCVFFIQSLIADKSEEFNGVTQSQGSGQCFESRALVTVARDDELGRSNCEHLGHGANKYSTPFR